MVLLEIELIIHILGTQVPFLEFVRSYKSLHLIRRIPHGIQRTYNSSHGSTCYIINRYPVFFKGTYHTDMSHTFGSTTAQNQTHLLGAGRKRQRQQCDYQRYASPFKHKCDLLFCKDTANREEKKQVYLIFYPEAQRILFKDTANREEKKQTCLIFYPEAQRILFKDM